jgi:type I restriction enzyme M protein
MKVKDKKDILLVDQIESKIWEMSDILRKENISSNNYDIILFLLSLYRDNYISVDFLNNQSVKYALIDCVNKIESYDLNKIGDHYLPIISSLTEEGIKGLIHILLVINKDIINTNYAELFDSILYLFSKSQGKYAGEFIQPLELTRLMNNLAELKPNSKVFNPFAGLGSFGIFLDDDQNYFSQENNNNTWALGLLRSLAYNKSRNYDYTLGDSINNWPDSTQKFDLIISNPPFGMRFNIQNNKGVNPNIRTIEEFIIEKSLDSLSSEGKLILLLPPGFLFRGSNEYNLRKFLVENDLIDSIISLPGGILMNTGIPLIVLIISKSKVNAGKVKFVDGKDYVSIKNAKSKVLDDDALYNLIKNNLEDDSKIRLIDNSQIIEENYNLNVPRYFIKKVNGIKLKELLTLIKGQKGNLPDVGKVIRIRDLKDENYDFILDVSKITDADLKRNTFHSVTESCLLLATRWSSLKPTLFEFIGEAIYRNQDILSFKIDETKVDKAYLVNELRAEYVQKQLESFLTGSAIPFIRLNDLLEIEVILPSLEEQRSKVDGIHELAVKLKRLEEEKNALIYGKSLNQFNEFASLKHTLGRPRQNILDWTDNLLYFFHKNRKGIESLNESFSDYFEEDIFSALEEIKRDVNFITDVLEKGENGLVLKEFEKHVIPLSDINSIITDLSSNGYNFSIKKLLLKGDLLKERGILANKTLLKTLLNNILTNAHKYAFDSKELGNEVVIELNEVDEYLDLEIKNNGKPFPKNFDREKFITKYSTADFKNGSGLGGYDIHRIASEFNNPDWNLFLNEDPLYFVKFKFQFPIQLMS